MRFSTRIRRGLRTPRTILLIIASVGIFLGSVAMPASAAPAVRASTVRPSAVATTEVAASKVTPDAYVWWIYNWYKNNIGGWIACGAVGVGLKANGVVNNFRCADDANDSSLVALWVQTYQPPS